MLSTDTEIQFELNLSKPLTDYKMVSIIVSATQGDYVYAGNIEFMPSRLIRSFINTDIRIEKSSYVSETFSYYSRFKIIDNNTILYTKGSMKGYSSLIIWVLGIK